ncbi:B-cell linker protein isoform X2 [Triplophysa dalaica]|uniref:B-cell linker protein isoform X2 n=1 Tax=Triplophysa dalaica TaxID=1582913 RepID=UPI0024E001D4|nr:B-cell linker protein isoform X2 [Triplophysa dalaica]
MSLPSRDQCETWSPGQVAAYLSQNNMRDCADTAQRLRIDGRRFLNLSEGDLNKFSLIHRPQIQKIVQDIKKNDDSLFNRLKRFQTEQTANILKSGRNTFDRIKKKGPPKVPTRDYQGDAAESEKYSDSDFDSDTYEDPQGDHEDNYEPPPRSEGHAGKGFTVSPSITNSRGQYADSCRGRPVPSVRLPERNKTPSTSRNQRTEHPHRHHQHNENDNYVRPQDEDNDDNYIDPTEKIPQKPCVNRGLKSSVPAPLDSPDVYEMPDAEENCQFNQSRSNTTLQVNTHMMPPKVSPRMQIRRPTATPETDSDDDYETCDADDFVIKRPEETRRPSIPTPRPRDLKKSSPALNPKPNVAHRDTEDITSPPTTGFHRVTRPQIRQMPTQSRESKESRESRATRDAEEEAGVYKKVWYSSSCDRRTAEDALIRSAKDGSFLLRKSSGVDTQQPYTLVVFYSGRVYNIPVRHITSSKQFALGKEKQGEERFSSVSDIIENHQNNPLVLVDSQNNTKDSTKLKHAVKP